MLRESNLTLNAQYRKESLSHSHIRLYLSSGCLFYSLAKGAIARVIRVVARQVDWETRRPSSSRNTADQTCCQIMKSSCSNPPLVYWNYNHDTDAQLFARSEKVPLVVCTDRDNHSSTSIWSI